MKNDSNPTDQAEPFEGDGGKTGDIQPRHIEHIGRLHADMSPTLRRIAWSIVRDWPLAEDAVQETFTLLSRRIGELTEENSDTTIEQRLTGWLVKSVQFQALNLRRQRARERRRWDSVADASGYEFSNDQPHSPEENLSKQETHAALRREIEQLPESQRDVVLRRMYDGLTFAQIAETLQTPLGTVLSRMRLALKKLHTALKDNDDNPNA